MIFNFLSPVLTSTQPLSPASVIQRLLTLVPVTVWRKLTAGQSTRSPYSGVGNKSDGNDDVHLREDRPIVGMAQTRLAFSEVYKGQVPSSRSKVGKPLPDESESLATLELFDQSDMVESFLSLFFGISL